MVLSIPRIGVARQNRIATQGATAPTGSDEPAVGNAEDHEVLRRLLGVPAPEDELQPEPEVKAPAVEA